jgi:hypothetical protein
MDMKVRTHREYYNFFPPGRNTFKSWSFRGNRLFDEMFSGRQPRQDVKVLQKFRDCLSLHLQGVVADGLVETKP